MSRNCVRFVLKCVICDFKTGGFNAVGVADFRHFMGSPWDESHGEVAFLWRERLVHRTPNLSDDDTRKGWYRSYHPGRAQRKDSLSTHCVTNNAASIRSLISLERLEIVQLWYHGVGTKEMLSRGLHGDFKFETQVLQPTKAAGHNI